MNEIFELNKKQKILFYSAMTAIFSQMCCIYYFLEEKERFKFDKCFCYLAFSALAYLFYYKMIV
jgi:hypothetical protein